MMFDYDPSSLKKMVYRILLRLANDPELFIGVITPTNSVRDLYEAKFKAVNVSEFHGTLSVQAYDPKQNDEIDFREGGIVVVNAQACKGLEFDVVFVADIDELHAGYNSAQVIQQQKLLYVVVARAREQLFLLKNRDRSAAVEVFLTKDETILTRKIAATRPNQYKHEDKP